MDPDAAPAGEQRHQRAQADLGQGEISAATALMATCWKPSTRQNSVIKPLADMSMDRQA